MLFFHSLNELKEVKEELSSSCGNLGNVKLYCVDGSMDWWMVFWKNLEGSYSHVHDKMSPPHTHTLNEYKKPEAVTTVTCLPFCLSSC